MVEVDQLICTPGTLAIGVKVVGDRRCQHKPNPTLQTPHLCKVPLYGDIGFTAQGTTLPNLRVPILSGKNDPRQFAAEGPGG